MVKIGLALADDDDSNDVGTDCGVLEAGAALGVDGAGVDVERGRCVARAYIARDTHCREQDPIALVGYDVGPGPLVSSSVASWSLW
ncbi:MAG: hypothetical protein ACOYJL_07420 [Tractidigestivibacter sp.]|jgi:hypothetical protein|uniref:hypothetical protein n=1 Tax=Tractidigestivibacter sp. TaxID=2847320 RepID=UPI003D92C876